MTFNVKKIFAIALVAVSLTGCGTIKEKVSGYYLSKARKTLALQNPSQAELETAYLISAKLEYRPASAARWKPSRS